MDLFEYYLTSNDDGCLSHYGFAFVPFFCNNYEDFYHLLIFCWKMVSNRLNM